jgi:hypothetical protein
MPNMASGVRAMVRSDLAQHVDECALGHDVVVEESNDGRGEHRGDDHGGGADDPQCLQTL